MARIAGREGMPVARRAGGLVMMPGILLGLVLGAMASPALAQYPVVRDTPVPLARLERDYSRMNVVHIEKCDRDHDGMYTKLEQLCVASIYRTLYRQHDRR